MPSIATKRVLLRLFFFPLVVVLALLRSILSMRTRARIARLHAQHQQTIAADSPSSVLDPHSPQAKLLQLSAVQLAKLIREQQVSSVEVVSAHIAQVRRVNPLVNAMVRDRFAAALAEAREADRHIAVAHSADALATLPPFLGVPCSIKECFAVAGLSQTGGSPHRADLIATRDATAVRRYRQAGFIVLGSRTSPSCACGGRPTTKFVFFSPTASQ
mmetsp:Transcript_14527/g.43640  ORF Transcript_14527/g.43640 Transcript_14527/m.43640 type:complete len:216 (-) Transcript_14527:76-723(-)